MLDEDGDLLGLSIQQEHVLLGAIVTVHTGAKDGIRRKDFVAPLKNGISIMCKVVGKVGLKNIFFVYLLVTKPFPLGT